MLTFEYICVIFLSSPRFPKRKNKKGGTRDENVDIALVRSSSCVVTAPRGGRNSGAYHGTNTGHTHHVEKSIVCREMATSASPLNTPNKPAKMIGPRYPPPTSQRNMPQQENNAPTGKAACKQCKRFSCESRIIARLFLFFMKQPPHSFPAAFFVRAHPANKKQFEPVVQDAWFGVVWWRQQNSNL